MVAKINGTFIKAMFAAETNAALTGFSVKYFNRCKY